MHTCTHTRGRPFPSRAFRLQLLSYSSSSSPCRSLVPHGCLRAPYGCDIILRAGTVFTLCGRQIFVRYDTAINNDNKQWERKQCACARARERIDERTGCVSRIGGKSLRTPRNARLLSVCLSFFFFFLTILIPALIIFSHRTLAGRSECPRPVSPDPVSSARQRAGRRTASVCPLLCHAMGFGPSE